MKSFFKEMFDYSSKANEGLIQLLAVNPDKDIEEALKLLSHIINSHRVWNSRLQLQNQKGIWDVFPLDVLAEQNSKNLNLSLELVDTLQFPDIIDYQNSAGIHLSNSIQNILFHVVNHSSYHRGQIAKECRRVGIEPFPTDFILFKKQ